MAIISGVFSLILLVLELITAYKVFEKYGLAGWKGLIPVYSDYLEYGKVWTKNLGIFYAVISVFSAIVGAMKIGGALEFIADICYIVAFVMNIMFASKKSKAFGKKLGTTLLLIFFPFIGNLYIGFGDAQYQGNN